MKLTLYKPKLEDLWFRKMMLEDEETMSYNHAWGGTVPFPVNDWEDWYDRWIVNHDNKRFYRYVKDGDTFVGEIAYHFDEKYQGHVANIIIFAKFRRKGYGKEALDILCKTAKENGVDVLYDDIAIDNAAITLFLKAGFFEEYQTNEIILLKKGL